MKHTDFAGSYDGVLYPAGTCSPIQTEAISQLQPETSVSCHLRFTSEVVDFPASDVFKTHTSFDPSIGKAALNSDQVSYMLQSESVRYRL